MSDAVPQHGFTQARRGYAPDQVERALAALTAQRDEAWERLSVLGAGIRQMEARLADIRRAAEEAPEPDYEVLSEQAAGLAAMAQNEARAVREKAERFSEDLRDEVYEAGQALDRAAKEYSTTTRTEADAAARRTDERTRAEAEGIRAEADRESRAVRDAATAYAAKVRVAAAEAGEQAEAELATRRRRADEDFAAAQAAADAEDAEVSATAERRVKEAEQHRETVLNRIKQLETDAQAKADQLVEQARREAEKINAASEREQAEFDIRLETVQQHLDHIKATLASLTGAAVGQIEPGLAAAAAARRGDAAPAPAPWTRLRPRWMRARRTRSSTRCRWTRRRTPGRSRCRRCGRLRLRPGLRVALRCRGRRWSAVARRRRPPGPW
ncbi:hypothetical protein [Streptomyces sp. 1331.2]|uniref:hypothetical protein n=1 Tax=Streptomyces sp. 1331.2 TaxID=1938835 RepID=UPI000BD4C6CB|nr:hypothetical protein [Streptomyces sp. 1331.2]SOB82372.1 hypothetical protein SAMN06272789_2533 [Streptomyces sp. 1331.2]